MNNTCYCNDSYGAYKEDDTCACDNEGDLGDFNCVYEVGETDILSPSSTILKEVIEVEYFTDAQVMICATEKECEA